MELAKLSAEKKNRALQKMALALENNVEAILSANRKDVESAKIRGLKPALLDRLALDERKIKNMAKCLREVAELPDPVGVILSTWTRPNGLLIGQLRVPLGVVGVIYESRPDVTSDAAGICLKSGNAVILRGGSDALNSNTAIGGVLKEALADEVPSDSIQVISSTERSVAEELMRMREYVDVLIPRGGADLIKTVVEKASVPVIETGTGNCHIYVEEDADLEKAVRIIINAKCQRPGTCNSAEKLLVHSNIASKFLPLVVSALRAEGVEVRADEQTAKIVSTGVKLATEEDWGTEYLDLIMGVKVVKDMDEAISHINKYGSKNSESILTLDFDKAQRFIREVDSAAIYWNASTRFTDGNQFGLGAEIGISTQKIHARGPMSVQHLTTTKYFILGSGQTRV